MTWHSCSSEIPLVTANSSVLHLGQNPPVVAFKGPHFLHLQSAALFLLHFPKTETPNP